MADMEYQLDPKTKEEELYERMMDKATFKKKQDKNNDLHGMFLFG